VGVMREEKQINHRNHEGHEAAIAKCSTVILIHIPVEIVRMSST